MPLVAGDFGWLRASDRDISLFRQSWKNSPPKRLHSFEDAVFEPDPMTGITIPSGHSGNLTIQSFDGTTCAAFNTSNNVIELDSTTKAFQIPRMTTAQRNAIPSPIGGQMVYATDSTPTPHFSFHTDGDRVVLMTVLSFSLNASNDIYINASGNLAVDENLAALEDICRNVSKALLGEEVLTTGNGIPYFQSVFNGTPNIANFQNYLTSQLNGVEGVNAVTNISISIADNTLTFVATIDTIYGPSTITSSVQLQ